MRLFISILAINLHLPKEQYAEAGWLGRKSGRGYYHYNDNPVKVEKIDNAKSKDIFERILVMLINEAVDALYLQIAI